MRQSSSAAKRALRELTRRTGAKLWLVLLVLAIRLPPAPGVLQLAAQTSNLFEPEVEERGVVALDQALRELTSPYSIACVASSADRIDAAALAYHRKKLGVRVVSIIATRRAAESSDLTLTERGNRAEMVEGSLAAARIVGSDMYFLDLPHPDPALSAAEVTEFWGHYEALRRLVKALRLTRPDVIVVGQPERRTEACDEALLGLALEGVKVTADPKVFPEHEELPWQVHRVFRPSSAGPADAGINIDEYNAVRGLTYGEIGRRADRFLRKPVAGPRRTGYKLVRGEISGPPLPISSLVEGIAIAETVTQAIKPPLVGDLSPPDAIALREPLVASLKEKLLEKRAEGSLDTLRERYGLEFIRVARFRESLERALALAVGVSFEAKPSDGVLVAGQEFLVRLKLFNGTRRAIPTAFHFPESFNNAENTRADYKNSDVLTALPERHVEMDIRYQVEPDTRHTTTPADGHNDKQYYPTGSALPGAIPLQFSGKSLLFVAEIGLDQLAITWPALVRLEVAPPVQVVVDPGFAVVTDWDKRRSMSFKVAVHNRTPGALSGDLWVVPKALTDNEYEPVRVDFMREDQLITFDLAIRIPLQAPPLTPDILIEFRPRTPGTPHAPLGFATIKVMPAILRIVEDLSVGYVRGKTGWLPLVLNQLSVQSKEITPSPAGQSHEEVIEQHGPPQLGRPCETLEQFQTIIIDRDAYRTHPQMVKLTACLLTFVRRGGNLVVLPQEAGDWISALVLSQLFPFPVKLDTSRQPPRIPSKISDPEHTVASKPNALTVKDFESWGRQDPVNLPLEWSAEYSAPFEAPASNGDVYRGGLLFARYGKGTFSYSSYSPIPELMVVEPGAYRLLANLISLPKTIGPTQGTQ